MEKWWKRIDSSKWFYSIFEKNGFIIELDIYVFEKVCILLKKLDIDTLKLDKEFCSLDLANDLRERKIILSILNLSKELNLTTVVEGVETKEQLEFFKESSCDLVQGYVFSKSLPIEAFNGQNTKI